MFTVPKLVVHGGAGVIKPLSPGEAIAIHSALSSALDAGRIVLTGGGSSLDAVEAAVRVLEDAPEFNAGRGAALTREGMAELDAAIMDGATGRAGAVANVTILRHPVSAAKLIMTQSEHVLMCGSGAERFAIAHGAEKTTQDWLVTARAQAELARCLGHSIPGPAGTVGAVAIDGQGHLAAATSTGGMTGKLPGRIGDTPIIGAGTWASSRCAVSATGTGEHFIKMVFAHRIEWLIENGLNPVDAAASALEGIRTLSGTGGCIVMDATGRPGLCQMADMYRGILDEQGIRTAIYGSDLI